MTKRRVAVIGAGIVGLVAASHLQRDGHEVAVVERDAPGAGASSGNAGCLNVSSIVPMSMPGTIAKVPHWLFDPLGPLSIRLAHLPVLLPWLARFVRAGRAARVEATARALRDLLARSFEHLQAVAEPAGAGHLLHHRGFLVVYRSAATRARSEGEWALRRANGIAFDELDAQALREVEPGLSPDFAHGVLVRANRHTSDPLRLVERLAEAFARAGGRIVRESATGFELAGSRLAAVRTDRGALAADCAVVAAGAWSKPLAARLGDRVPLETERGYHVMIRDPEVMPRLPTLCAEGKFVATPMDAGLRLAGTVELAGLDAPADWRRARMLLRQGAAMYPGLAREPPEARLAMWMGHRPGTPDSLPVIGRARRSRDVIYAFGHGHIGMAAAGTTGRIVADLVAGRAPEFDIAPFSAMRFD